MSLSFFGQHALAQYQMENLNRGVVAVDIGGGDVYVGWRLFGTESENTAFNIYRNNTKLNDSPITASTNYVDQNGSVNASYHVRPVVDGVEQGPSESASVWNNHYLSIPLNRPSGDYHPNDLSVGDLNGDGDYEIIIKWEPANAKDNSQAGYTDNVYLEAVEMDGNSLWRIDLGRNIRAGAHYTQFMVYDFDGDGKSELACKTAPGTVDGQGNNVVMNNDDPNADYRNSGGYILSGPEYLTVFEGETGAELATAAYVPPRGNVSSWGDDYGNRVDRFVAGVGYFDGERPSIIMARGYYSRMAIAAWDFRNGQLSQRWVFDTDNGMQQYEEKGNHQLSIGDIDDDGKDEVIYGAIAVDDDGSLQHATSWYHGDALHVSDFDLDNPGLEIFMPTESASANPADGRPAVAMRDGESGDVLWATYADGDVGRGICANIDARYPGAECWGSSGQGLFDSKGNNIGNIPEGANFSIWWDADRTRELLDGTKLDKWNTNGGGSNERIFTIYNDGAEHINGSKANPNLQADILGDWREELIYRHYDNDRLLVFTTTDVTEHRIHTLMHDPQYRTAIAWQNSGYNQPPHPSFYIGEDMQDPPIPDITLVGGEDCQGVEGGSAFIDECGTCVGGTTGQEPCIIDCNGDEDGTAFTDECGTCVGGNTGLSACAGVFQMENSCTIDGVTESVNSGYTGDGYANVDNQTGTSITFTLISEGNQNVSLDFTYAIGTANNRNLSVSVNGNTVVGDLTFIPTGNWSDWSVVSTSIELSDGINTIELTSLSADGGPNLDQVTWDNELVSTGTCDTDCNGDFGGVAFTDECDKCVGGNTGQEPCEVDCNGDENGEAYTDECGDCVGGNTGQEPCVVDCAGLENGAAYTDNCGVCVEGATGINPCIDLTDGFYTISPVSSDLCLSPGSPVTQEICDRSDGQVFRVERVGDNYEIISVSSAEHIGGGAGASGEYVNTTAIPVTVRLEDAGSGTAHIVPVDNTDLVFDVEGRSTTAGTGILLWTRTGGTNQQFIFTPSDIVTGKNERIISGQVQCFPNPFSEQAELKMPGTFQYSIYNTAGVLLQSGKGENSVSLGKDLSPGFYVVKLEREGKVHMLRINKY